MANQGVFWGANFPTFYPIFRRGFVDESLVQGRGIGVWCWWIEVPTMAALNGQGVDGTYPRE